MAEKKVSAKKALRVVRPQVIALTFTGAGNKLAQLQVCNSVLAVVFALQAIAVYIFGNGRSFPVSVNYLTADPLQSAAQGVTVRSLAMHQLFSVNVLWLATAALLAMAAVHGLLATRYRTHYEAAVTSGTNKLRWIGYAVMTSLLMLSSGLVLGVQDVAVLSALVALSILQNMAGWTVERHDILGATRQRLAMICGGLAGATGIAILAVYMLASRTYGTATQGYLYASFVTDLLALLLFSTNLFLHHRRVGKWADNTYAEWVYMTLGLVFASAITWQIFAGALA